MTSRLTVTKAGGIESRPLIAALSAAVYPPDVLAAVPWRNVQSARSEHRILVTDRDEVVVGVAGLLIRMGMLDGNPVQIGGVGGVMTMPARQGNGIGRVAMEAIATMMHDFPKMQFGLLFCEPKNMGFYHKLGWYSFDGTVEVQQENGRQTYDIMRVMVLPVYGEAPQQGQLDICGLPW